VSEAGDSHQVQGFAIQGGFRAIRQLKFEFLPHLPICWDLAVSDYHTFGPLKQVSHGQRLPVVMKLSMWCITWLWSQLSSQMGSEVL